jgi:CheY-like chemotaxis protein
VAKILVADDNSNVQKTVALALADLGIEVVAVNNGEAAVKKLPDVMPDLVLADIFMPVRNGYEVCEYVKKDSRFSHVPVVLLVGAFDPLDEREAQRVGADGILKKPFVPPDPLIAMVKTLLDRTLGDRLVTAAVSKPVAAMQSRSGGIAVADDHNSSASMFEESREETSRPNASRLSFGDGDRPVAFSQLLGVPAMETSSSHAQLDELADNDQILTSTRDESLGAPIFWKTESPEQEIKDGDSDAEADASNEIPAVGWRLGNETLPSHPESDSEETEEPLELVHDQKDTDSNQVSTIVEPSPLRVQDSASQASLTVEASKATDLAANPLEWMASVPLPKVDDVPVNIPEWSAAVPEPTDNIEAKEPETQEPAMELAAAEIPAAYVPPISVTPEAIPSAKSEATLSIPEPSVMATLDSNTLNGHFSPAANSQSVEDTVRSISKQDWTDLAASLQPKAVEPVHEEVKPSISLGENAVAEQAALPAAPTVPAQLDSKPLAQSMEDTAHSLPKHDWAGLVSDLKSRSGDSIAEKNSSSPELANRQTVSAEAKAQPTSPAFEPPVSKPSNDSLEDTAHSLPKLDWADLAASLQPRAKAPAIEKAMPAPSAFANASSASPVNEKSTSVSDLAAARETSANHQDIGESTLEASSASAPPAAPAGPDPALVEAVVQRVLDKMRPQVVDIITKEFLRPIVQALVHREITKR